MVVVIAEMIAGESAPMNPAQNNGSF